MRNAKWKLFKLRVFEIISKADEGDRLSRAFDTFIMILIGLSVVSIVLESFPQIAVRYYRLLDGFETFTVIVFTIEYLLRIWTADMLYKKSKHPYLKYIFSAMAIIDLLAIVPYYLPFFSADLRFLRMMRLLRMFRILRVLKLGRYFDALQVIFRVIKTSAPQLIMSVAVCLFVMLFSAIVMYSVEYSVQPQQFPNVIATLWWAICTLTTVGYGDVYPITPVGKIFASIISLVGIGIIAIPTGIIAAGFNRVFTREEEEEEKAEIEKRAIDELVDRMDEKELVALQARASSRLREFGYETTVTIRAQEGAGKERPGLPGNGDQP